MSFSSRRIVKHGLLEKASDIWNGFCYFRRFILDVSTFGWR